MFKIITINDTTNPTIVCPGAQIQTTSAAIVSLNDFTAMATVSDNCSAVVTVTQTPVIGSIQNLGDVSVTLTATDECGNTSDCSFVVTVSNSSAITWTNQPMDMTVECDVSILTFNTGLATANTTCGSGG